MTQRVIEAWLRGPNAEVLVSVIGAIDKVLEEHSSSCLDDEGERKALKEALFLELLEVLALPLSRAQEGG